MEEQRRLNRREERRIYRHYEGGERGGGVACIQTETGLQE